MRSFTRTTGRFEPATEAELVGKTVRCVADIGGAKLSEGDEVKITSAFVKQHGAPAITSWLVSGALAFVTAKAEPPAPGSTPGPA